MKSLPRLLPLVGVAVAGVLALKLAGGFEGVSQLFGATASAEEASGASPGKRHAPPAKTEADKAEPQVSKVPGELPGLPAVNAAATAPAQGPPVCAPTPAELARQAGLSPAELQVIQNLGARRGQLDAREQAFDTQLQLIAAAEHKLDGRLQALNALKAEIQTLVGEADGKQQAEIDRLVTVYEKMRPRDAGPLMAALDDKVRVPFAAKMKPAALAAILSQMGTAQAKSLTESLAKRFNPAQGLAQILDGKGAPPATAAAAAPAPPQTAAPEAAKAAASRPGKRQARAPARSKPPTKVAKAAAVDAGAVAAPGATSPAATGAAPAPTKAASAAPAPSATSKPAA
ncbi:hypothetical protein BH09PSE2_BH09PSE2_23520 [soil metagenome]